MIDRTDFEKKQIIFYIPSKGEKISFKNDNLAILDKDKKVKVQVTCYRIFLVFVIGDTSITTGLINRANKFGFSICLMNRSMKVYKFIGARMEGNTVLRKKQYEYQELDQAEYILKNKIQNQRNALNKIRNKNQLLKDAIQILDNHIANLANHNENLQSLMGVEGSAARTYFSQMFDFPEWKGRKPRIKCDYINATLDIGYTILFNVIDALLNVYGFDEYYGVMHTCFYMRKSLVCDLMEPFRPIVDYSVRKAINLKQVKEDDYKIMNHRYVLEWNKSADYSKMFMDAILENKNEIFLYIQSYYRAVMKGKEINDFPVFEYR